MSGPCLQGRYLSPALFSFGGQSLQHLVSQGQASKPGTDPREKSAPALSRWDDNCSGVSQRQKAHLSVATCQRAHPTRVPALARPPTWALGPSSLEREGSFQDQMGRPVLDRRLDFSYFSICKVTALWVQGPRSMSALVSLAARALGSHGRREGGGQGRVVFLVRASAQSLTQPILQSVKHNPGRPVQSTWLPSAGGYAGNHPKLEESSTRVPRQSFAPTSPIKLPKKR